MCRGGRMFAPTKTWRRWHRRVNVNEKRTAVASALAASALPSLVLARGHRIEQIPEIPLVIPSKALVTINKTSKAVTLLESLNAFADVEKVKESHKIRAGKGKARNRRYVQRRGPLVIYSEKSPFIKAFRNLPGVEIANVNALNILQLAPGGHLGRFIIWTKDAFSALDKLYGTFKVGSSIKKGFSLPRPILQNTDIARIVNSDEVQSKLRRKNPKRVLISRKKNPLKNFQFLVKLNPYAKTVKRQALIAQKKRAEKKLAIIEAKRKGVKEEAKKDEKQKTSSTKVPANKHFKEILFS